MTSDPRFSRRALTRAGLGLTALASVGAVSASTSAAPKIESTERGEMPTTGGLRPGPIGLNPPPVVFSGARPVTLTIDTIGVNAQVETIEIVDGVMQDPTGPWVVSWYKETARPGEEGNIVFAGHVDYWDVGPAVFYSISTLQEDAEIQVSGDDNQTYVYLVDTVTLYDAANAPVGEIVGETEDPAITLITCGGPFDYQTGEYLQRTVVRGIFDRTESNDESS